MDYELFGSLDGQHSQYSYVAFLRDVEEWKSTVLKDANDGSKFELKPWIHPLDDKIPCVLRWMEEPDRLKVLRAMAKLNFGSSFDPVFQAARIAARGRKYEVKWMKGPMAVFEVLIELQKPDYRENALLVLSSYLIEVLEDDFERYKLIGPDLYQFCGTVNVLLREITEAYAEFSSNEVTLRTSRRIVNVLILLQCIAANKETRNAFLEALTPNYLIPLILSDDTDNHYEIVRMVSLSVIGIICQAVTWAFENDVILACRHAIQTGSRVSKLISLHILEAILKSEKGLCAFACNHLETVMETLKNLVTLEAADQSPYNKGLLFPIMRCYMLLGKDQRTIELVRAVLPPELQNDTVEQLLKGRPDVLELWQEFLFALGRLEPAF